LAHALGDDRPAQLVRGRNHLIDVATQNGRDHADTEGAEEHEAFRLGERPAYAEQRGGEHSVTTLSVNAVLAAPDRWCQQRAEPRDSALSVGEHTHAGGLV